MRSVLGFDGGGTKTECVLMNDSAKILARTRSGPSNAVNVGAHERGKALTETGGALSGFRCGPVWGLRVR